MKDYKIVNPNYKGSYQEKLDNWKLFMELFDSKEDFLNYIMVKLNKILYNKENNLNQLNKNILKNDDVFSYRLNAWNSFEEKFIDQRDLIDFIHAQINKLIYDVKNNYTKK